MINQPVEIKINNKIAYIQGTDYVPQGTGGLVRSEGGVGHLSGILWLQSGVGEDLRFNILVYGEDSN